MAPIPQNLLAISHHLPTGFKARPATSNDVAALTDIFYHSFTPSHAFWPHLIPDDAASRKWWEDSWRMGIEDDDTAIAFIVEEEATGKPAAFSRWILPQKDGNLHRMWPDLPEHWDGEVSEAFFGGMDVNREQLMGKRPHWMLELLAVNENYQGRGIAVALVDWGCKIADGEDLEVYLDASMKGAPLYKTRFGFGVKEKPVVIPDRPDSYGTYKYTSLVRPRKSDVTS